MSFCSKPTWNVHTRYGKWTGVRWLLTPDIVSVSAAKINNILGGKQETKGWDEFCVYGTDRHIDRCQDKQQFLFSLKLRGGCFMSQGAGDWSQLTLDDSYTGSGRVGNRKRASFRVFTCPYLTGAPSPLHHCAVLDDDTSSRKRKTKMSSITADTVVCMMCEKMLSGLLQAFVEVEGCRRMTCQHVHHISVRVMKWLRASLLRLRLSSKYAKVQLGFSFMKILGNQFLAGSNGSKCKRAQRGCTVCLWESVLASSGPQVMD